MGFWQFCQYPSWVFSENRDTDTARLSSGGGTTWGVSPVLERAARGDGYPTFTVISCTAFTWGLHGKNSRGKTGRNYLIILVAMGGFEPPTSAL